MTKDNSEGFWDNLRKEIKSIGTDTRASDMRRFKAYMIDRVFAMEQGTKIRESLLSSQVEKLQALEENLTECASSYWKEVEKRKAAEEKLKLKTQNEIDASVNADCLAGGRVKLKAAEDKIQELEKDLKDSIYQFEQLVVKYEKLQAVEEKLTECASNYWKEVEKRKAAEEENKILREAVEHCVDDVIDAGPDSYRNTVCLSLVSDILEQALEKTKRGGE